MLPSPPHALFPLPHSLLMKGVGATISSPLPLPPSLLMKGVGATISDDYTRGFSGTKMDTMLEKGDRGRGRRGRGLG